MIDLGNEVQQEALKIQELIKDYIPEGVEITMDYYCHDWGGSGGSLRCKSNREISTQLSDYSWDSRELRQVLSNLEDYCPKFNRMHMSLYKTGEPKVSLYEAVDFIEDIDRKLKIEINKNALDAMEVVARFEKDRRSNNAYVEVVETTISDGKTGISEYSFLKDDLEYLYYSLDRQPKTIRVNGNKDRVVFEADVAYSDFGIGLMEDSTQDNGRILRYILSDYVGEDYISYGYMSDKDSRRFVDFVGGLVKEYMDMETYVTQAKLTNSESELLDLYNVYAKKVHQGITQKIQGSNDETFKEACQKLMNMNLDRVLFEKTHLWDANESPVLREYMFFLSLISKNNFYMDIHQSDTPDLTEVYWMLGKIPETNWSDVEPEYPEYPLQFERR